MSELDLKDTQLNDMLVRLIDTIHRSDDIIDIFSEAVKQLSLAVKCDYANILFNNESAKYFYIDRALNQTSSDPEHEVIIPYHETAIIEIIRSHRSIIRDDLTQRGTLTPGDLKFLANGIKSDLSTPIICRNRVFAIINLSSYQSHYFTENFQYQTEQITSLLGLALERTELIEKLNRKESDLLFLKNKFNYLFSNIDEAVAIIRLDSDLIYQTNSAFQKLTGYNAEELHGIRLSYLHPQQEELILLHTDKPSNSDERKTIGQLNLVCKDGLKIPVRLHFVYFGADKNRFVYAIYEKLGNKNSSVMQPTENSATNQEFARLQLVTYYDLMKLGESDLQLDAIIRAALLNIKKVTDFDFAQISLFDAANENVEHHTIISDRFREYDPRKNWSILEEFDFCWHSVDRQNLKEQFEQRENNADKIEHQLQSRISTVLMSRNHCLGTFVLGSLEPNFYPSHTIEFIKQIAAQVALLIENVTLADEHKKTTLSAAVQSDLKKIIGTDWDVDHVLSSIVNLSANRMQAQLATVELMEKDKSTSDFIASDPECNKTLLSNYEKENIIPAIFESTEPFIIVNVPFDDLEKLKCPISKSLGDCITCLAVPIKFEDAIIGVLSNYWNKPFQIDPISQLQITVIAERASEAIYNAKVYQDIIYRSERLAAARNELENFVTTVSHNLRTPLASILGFASTLRDKLKDEISDESQGYLQKIRIKSIQMQHHIDALYQLASVGQIIHPLVEINISDLVEQTRQKLSNLIQKKNIKIVATKELPNIHGDRNLIQQVFLCLIENAINDLSDDIAKPRIEIGYRPTNGESIYYVRNNAISNGRNLEEEIFDLFNSENGHETEKTRSNLNLAIAKKIIEMHDGKIWLESAEGKGITINISLPRKKY